MTNEVQEKNSPKWTNTTKLVVGMTAVAIVALLLVQFRTLIAPMILAVILSYLLYPGADFVRNKMRISWGFSVTLIYLILVLVLAGLLFWGGITIVDPIISLVNFLTRAFNDLPELISELTNFSFHIGTFELSLANFDVGQIVEQVLGVIEPLVSGAGSVVGTIASGAASTIGMFLLVLVVSYFVLAETDGARDRIINLDIPGYQYDMDQLGQELDRIWNAFLRGQMILIMMTIVVYFIFLSLFGVNFAIGLAIMAGLARFLPYVGPWIAWVTYFLVCLLQGETIFGMDPLIYSVFVLGFAVLLDTFLDNFIAPRIFSNTLKVHPAGVLIALLVSAAWLGLIGVVLAAPVLASVKLFANYGFHKMLDLDPWDSIKKDQNPPAPDLPTIEQIKKNALYIWEKLKNRIRNSSKKNSKMSDVQKENNNERIEND